MKREEDNFFISICLILVLVLFIVFLLTLFGAINLRIVNEIYVSPILGSLINFTMFIINIFFMFSISFGVFNRKIIFIILGYIPIFLICNATGACALGLVFSSLPPILYVLLITFLFFKKRMGQTALSMGLFSTVVSIYQPISGFIKLNNFSISFNQPGILGKLVYSVDLYVVYLLLYLGVRLRVYLAVENLLRKIRLLGKSRSSIVKPRKNNEDAVDVSILNKRQRIIFRVLVLFYQILQMFTILGTNFLINKIFYIFGSFYIGLIELTLGFITLEIFRAVLGKTYHSVPVRCNVVSLAVYFVFSRFALPISVSLFCNTLISALMAFLIYLYAIKKEEHESLLEDKQKRDSFKSKSRRSRAEIILQTLKTNHLDYSLLEDYVKGETLEVLADKYNMSFSTVNRKINALTQK